MTRESERQEALLDLLALPDPPCLKTPDGVVRGYRYLLSRDPRRDPDVLKRDLMIAYGQRRSHEHGKDISSIESVRRQRKLRLVVNE